MTEIQALVLRYINDEFDDPSRNHFERLIAEAYRDGSFRMQDDAVSALAELTDLRAREACWKAAKLGGWPAEVLAAVERHDIEAVHANAKGEALRARGGHAPFFDLVVKALATKPGDIVILESTRADLETFGWEAVDRELGLAKAEGLLPAGVFFVCIDPGLDVSHMPDRTRAALLEVLSKREKAPTAEEFEHTKKALFQMQEAAIEFVAQLAGAKADAEKWRGEFYRSNEQARRWASERDEALAREVMLRKAAATVLEALGPAQPIEGSALRALLSKAMRIGANLEEDPGVDREKYEAAIRAAVDALLEVLR